MAKYHEIKKFNVGTIRNADETDIPEESSSFSVDIEQNDDSGMLKGAKKDAIISDTGLYREDNATQIRTGGQEVSNPTDGTVAINSVNPLVTKATSKGKGWAILTIENVQHLIYYSNNKIYKLNNIFKGQGSIDSSTKLSVEEVEKGHANINGVLTSGGPSTPSSVNHEASAVIHNNAVYLGISESTSKWIGEVPHEQFGLFQNEGGVEEGSKNVIIQDSKLKTPELFTELQWVDGVGDGYVYGAEWEGRYVYRFKYNSTSDSYEVLGQSATVFNRIAGISARQPRTGETEGGCFVYETRLADNVNAGSYGKLVVYFREGLDNVYSSHSIANVYKSGDGLTETTTDEYFELDKIGCIMESRNNGSDTKDGKSTIYFAKYLNQESIIDQDNLVDGYYGTGEYRQKSFLYKVSNFQNVNINTQINLVNCTPHMSTELTITRNKSGSNHIHNGFENIYITNPKRHEDADELARHGGVGGDGVLQGVTDVADKNYIKDMSSGYNTGKKFGIYNTESGILPQNNETGHHDRVIPDWYDMKCDSWPSHSWHQVGGSNSCLRSPEHDARPFTQTELSGDGLGLMFIFYQTDEADDGVAEGTASYRKSTNNGAGVTIVAYHKGKGYWADSDKENPSEAGSNTHQMGQQDGHPVSNIGWANNNSYQDLRMSGGIYSGTDTNNEHAKLLNQSDGIGIGQNGNDANEKSNMGGIGCIDTDYKLVFWSKGVEIHCAQYTNTGSLLNPKHYDTASNPFATNESLTSPGYGAEDLLTGQTSSSGFEWEDSAINNHFFYGIEQKYVSGIARLSNYKVNSGQMIDTKNKYIAWGTAYGDFIGLMRYDKDCNISLVEQYHFHSGRWDGNLANTGSTLTQADFNHGSTYHECGISDIILCPENNAAYIMCFHYGTTYEDIRNYFIMWIPYGENGFYDPNSEEHITEKAPVFTEPGINLKTGWIARDSITGWKAKRISDETQGFQFSRSTQRGLGHMGIDGDWGLLFWTAEDNREIRACPIEMDGDTAGQWDMSNINSISLNPTDYDDYEGNGQALGFRVDPVNHVIYGTCSAKGTYTIKYNKEGKMCFLSNIKAGDYGGTVSGLGADTGGEEIEWATKFNLYSSAMTTAENWDYRDYGTNNAAISSHSHGTRVVQLAQLGMYNANPDSDDSYSTGAMLYTAFTCDKYPHNFEMSPPGTPRNSGIVGAVYNFCTTHVQIPKNSLVRGTMRTSGGAPRDIHLLLRTNGFGFDTCQVPYHTTPQLASTGKSHGQVYGNMCSFVQSGYPGDGSNGRHTTATWGLISLQDYHPTTEEPFIVNTQYFTLMSYLNSSAEAPGSTDILVGPYRTDVNSALSYTLLRPTAWESYNDTHTGKDRSRTVWATPHSAAFIRGKHDDGGTYHTYLAIACGHTGSDGVSSVILIEGVHIDQGAAVNTGITVFGGITSIGYSDQLITLLNRVPSAKIVHFGADVNEDYVEDDGVLGASYGRLNFFAGEGSGMLGTLDCVLDGTLEGTEILTAPGDYNPDANFEGFTEQLEKLVEITAKKTTGNGYPCESTGDVFYRASFVFDGYQEGPLGNVYWKDLQQNSGTTDMEVTVKIASIRYLNQDFARVSGIKIYRAVNSKHRSNPQEESLYRFIKEFKLTQDDFLGLVGVGGKPVYEATFIDTNSVKYSYEAYTGLSEVLLDTSLNYELSCQLNSIHFVGRASNPLDTGISKSTIFKSEPYNFSQFNIIRNRLNLPFIPTALVGFNGRVWAFDKNNTCKIEPNQFYIEDIYEGAGCLSQKTVLTTEHGMFYCDDSNIYFHNGRAPQIISHAINGGTYAWNSKNRVKGEDYEMIAYDAKNQTVLFYFVTEDDNIKSDKNAGNTEYVRTSGVELGELTNDLDIGQNEELFEDTDSPANGKELLAFQCTMDADDNYPPDNVIRINGEHFRVWGTFPTSGGAVHYVERGWNNTPKQSHSSGDKVYGNVFDWGTGYGELANSSFSYAWRYSLLKKRWDLLYQGQVKSVSVSISGTPPSKFLGSTADSDKANPIMSVTSPHGNALIFSEKANEQIKAVMSYDSERRNWYWHSKDIDFDSRTIDKKISRIKLEGKSLDFPYFDEPTNQPRYLGGDIPISNNLDRNHPGEGMANTVDEGIIIERDGIEEFDSNKYRVKKSGENSREFKFKDRGKRFKLKLQRQAGTSEISGIGISYRQKKK